MAAIIQESVEDVETYRMFIGGKWENSSSGAYLDVLNPFTGRSWAKVPRGNSKDVDSAVDCAKKALESESWGEMTGASRRGLLLRLGQLIEQNAESLALAETKCNGRVYRESLPLVKTLAEWFYYYAGWADKMVGETIPLTTTRKILCYTLREPIGIVAAVTPWNSPLMLTVMKMAPSFAAGDTFILKPSRYTPVSAIILAKLAEEAGFPAGVFNVLTGTSSEVGNVLLKHRGINKIAFTGSTETGREVLKSASESIAKVTLELGGKSPNIVFDDAQMEEAVNGVLHGIFGFNGQICVSGSRILLHSKIKDDFVQRLVSKTQRIRLGDPLSTEIDIGPISNPEQMRKIEQYVEIGKKEGAQLICGGKKPDDPMLAGGLFYLPTIMEMRNEMRVAQEEIFGPVAGIIEFSSDEEAIRIANDIPMGLAAGIWTKDVRRAHRVAQKLKAGTVWINTYKIMSAAAPFGGYKQSGIGRENGYEAMREFSQVKSVFVDLSSEEPDQRLPAQKK